MKSFDQFRDLTPIELNLFTISKEKLQLIREQIAEDGNFEIEIIENDWTLDISGTGRYECFYEKETNSNLETFDKIEISLKVWDENGDSFDFSDEFEKGIFDQINVITK